MPLNKGTHPCFTRKLPQAAANPKPPPGPERRRVDSRTAPPFTLVTEGEPGELQRDLHEADVHWWVAGPGQAALCN